MTVLDPDILASLMFLFDQFCFLPLLEPSNFIKISLNAGGRIVVLGFNSKLKLQTK